MLAPVRPLPGLPATDYYAPDFKVEVEGRQLDPTTKGDVLDLKVVLDIDDLSSFDLTINNWDDRRLSFKYSDDRIFEVGNRVHVQMGYADGLRSMLRGPIVSMSPKFPESGSPTLAVSGSDDRVRLRDRKATETDVKVFPNMAAWEIAQVVGARNRLRVEVTREGPRYEREEQGNLDDARFLLMLAKRIDFEFYVQTPPDTGEDILHFVKPTAAQVAARARKYQFEWGKNLIDFNPTLNLSRQVGSVTVRGWDPRTKRVIRYTAGPADLPGASEGGTSGPEAVEERLGEKQDRVIDMPVASQQEARELAISLLRERAYNFITGSGQVIGLPDLRPGQYVELLRLGRRFSGEYFVEKVEHTLGSSGYLTQFEVRRPYDGGPA